MTVLAVSEEDPRQQGLKLHRCDRDAGLDPVSEEDPRQQGLKPRLVDEDIAGLALSARKIHDNKD